MRPYQIPLPADSLIQTALPRNDYFDAFAIQLPEDVPVSLERLPNLFFQVFPGWFKGLMYIREGIGRLVGLKTADGIDIVNQMKEFKGEVGQSIALFHVLGRTEEEIMTGENDSHLDFRLSFMVRPEGKHHEIALITTVMFNGIAGKAYFLPVKPIHRLIVPIILKRMAKRLKASRS